jgi:hypothetical protein
VPFVRFTEKKPERPMVLIGVQPVLRCAAHQGSGIDGRRLLHLGKRTPFCRERKQNQPDDYASAHQAQASLVRSTA